MPSRGGQQGERLTATKTSRGKDRWWGASWAILEAGQSLLEESLAPLRQHPPRAAPDESKRQAGDRLHRSASGEPFRGGAARLRGRAPRPQIREIAAVWWMTLDETVEIEGELLWKTAAACRSRDGHGRLLYQVVPAPETVKDRVHLHLHIHVGDDRDTVIARCIESRCHEAVGREASGVAYWATTRTPRGNGFASADPVRPTRGATARL